MLQRSTPAAENSVQSTPDLSDDEYQSESGTAAQSTATQGRRVLFDSSSVLVDEISSQLADRLGELENESVQALERQNEQLKSTVDEQVAQLKEQATQLAIQKSQMEQFEARVQQIERSSVAGSGSQLDIASERTASSMSGIAALSTAAQVRHESTTPSPVLTEVTVHATPDRHSNRSTPSSLMSNLLEYMSNMSDVEIAQALIDLGSARHTYVLSYMCNPLTRLLCVSILSIQTCMSFRHKIAVPPYGRPRSTSLLSKPDTPTT